MTCAERLCKAFAFKEYPTLQEEHQSSLRLAFDTSELHCVAYVELSVHLQRQHLVTSIHKAVVISAEVLHADIVSGGLSLVHLMTCMVEVSVNSVPELCLDLQL